MGNDDKFGIGDVEALTGVAARLVLMFCSLLNAFTSVMASLRVAAASIGRTDDASWHHRPIYDAWSIQPRNRHCVSVGSALPFASGHFSIKSKNTNLVSIGNHPGDVKKFMHFFLEKIINIGLKQNNNYDRNIIFMVSVGRLARFGSSSTNATSLHGAADGGKSALRTKGYLIPI